MTPKEQVARHEKLRADLKAGGYQYTEVTGHYEGAEKTFLVMAHNMSAGEVQKLGEKYNQDSVIHVSKGNNKMHFTAGDNKGKYHTGKGHEEKPEAKDYYTVVKHPGGNQTKFALNFNWDTMNKAMEKDMSGIKELEQFAKGGLYIGPKGGKWADAKHTIPYKEGEEKETRANPSPETLGLGIRHNEYKVSGIKDGKYYLHDTKTGKRLSFSEGSPHGKAITESIVIEKPKTKEKPKKEKMLKVQTAEELGLNKEGASKLKAITSEYKQGKITKQRYNKVVGILSRMYGTTKKAMDPAEEEAKKEEEKEEKHPKEMPLGTSMTAEDEKGEELIKEKSMSSIDELEQFAKGGPHKYVSRKMGPKGKWVYEYEKTGGGKKGSGGDGTKVVSKFGEVSLDKVEAVKEHTGFFGEKVEAIPAGVKATITTPIGKTAWNGWNATGNNKSEAIKNLMSAIAVRHGANLYAEASKGRDAKDWNKDISIATKLGNVKVKYNKGEGRPSHFVAVSGGASVVGVTQSTAIEGIMKKLGTAYGAQLGKAKKSMEASMSSIEELEQFAKGSGEGSRGGHVIGHTASGKPIYGTMGVQTAKHHKDRLDHHRAKTKTAVASGDYGKAEEHMTRYTHHLAHHRKATSEKDKSMGAIKRDIHAEMVVTLTDRGKTDKEKEFYRKQQEHHDKKHYEYRANNPYKQDTKRKSEKSMEASMSSIDELEQFAKGGPYIGPKGGKYADPQHKIAWKEGGEKPEKQINISTTLNDAVTRVANWGSYGWQYVSDAVQTTMKEKGLVVENKKNPGNYILNAKGKALAAKVWGEKEKKPRLYDPNPATSKSMEDNMDNDLEKAQTMPSGEPTMGGVGGEQGGPLAGKGKTSGSGDSSSGPPVNAPKTKKEKLSEDDQEDEKQMKPHKKPIETAKSFNTTPQGQRDSVAQEHAARVAQLRKGEDDVEVGVGVQAPQSQPEEFEKGREWNQGEDSRVAYSDQADREAAALAKSDAFYPHGAPTLNANIGLTHSRTCTGCKSSFMKSLAVCPSCGLGALEHTVLPGVALGEQPLEKSERKGPILRPRRNQDLVLPNGYKPSDR